MSETPNDKIDAKDWLVNYLDRIDRAKWVGRWQGASILAAFMLGWHFASRWIW